MSRRGKNANKEYDARATLEQRLGPDVVKRLEAMAHEFVRFERGQFGFYIDPARYAVKQRQVGPLGRGRRRKVVAGVDKDGNIITAWIGVDAKAKGSRTDGGEMVTIPEAYAEGALSGGMGGGGGGMGGGFGPGGGGGPGFGPGNGAGGPGFGPGAGGGPGMGPGGAGPGVGGAAAAAAAAKQNQAAKGGLVGGPGAIQHNGPDAPAPPSGPIAGKDNAARGRQKKPLHWAKVPMNLLNGSVWPTLEEAEVRLDEEEIDGLFGVDVVERFALSMQQEVKQEVLPHKRKHNINILLANLKMSSDAIKDVVRVPTYKSLEPQTLSALLLICPDLEEEQLLQKNLELKDKVDATDAFMMELSDLKGLRGKILCALSAKTFNEEAVDVIRSMDTCAMIPVEVMNSEKLKKTLQSILALGNFLNSGTGRGGAHGFKLEALAMMSTVKDARGGTLLDYLVYMLERDAPGLLPLDDMPTLPRSAEISLEAIGEDVTNLLSSVTNVTEQINQIGEDQTLAAFKAEMEIFAGEATKVRDEITSLRGLMMQKLELMMGHFGERNKKSRARQEDLLRMLREFKSDVEAAMQRAKEKRERQQKTAARAAQQGPTENGGFGSLPTSASFGSMPGIDAPSEPPSAPPVGPVEVDGVGS